MGLRLEWRASMTIEAFDCEIHMVPVLVLSEPMEASIASTVQKSPPGARKPL